LNLTTPDINTIKNHNLFSSYNNNNSSNNSNFNNQENNYNNYNKNINLSGCFIYKNIRINMNFLDIIEELEIKIRFPLRLKIQAYCFLNKSPTESQGIVIEVLIF
jgi:hypothetical protein